MIEEINFAQAELAISRIADIAEDFAWQAGVGAAETAGMILSYLAEHPRDIEPFLRHGVFELPDDWMRTGRLTWMSKAGPVVHPSEIAK